MRNVVPAVPSTRSISPPWARTSSAAMARPSPAPPVRVEPWNASNRWARARSERPGPGVGHLDDGHGALAPPGDADLIAAGSLGALRLQGLARIASEVHEHAQELLAVGIDGEAALDRGDPADPPIPATGRWCRGPRRRRREATPCGGPAPAPGRGRRTGSTGRTRWRVRAPASAWARSAAPADREASPGGRRKAAPRPKGCADHD